MQQVISKDQKAHDSYGTTNIDLHYGQEFSSPVGGNTVTPLVSGKAYFASLIEALRGASSEVLIAGWQINWDAQIGPDGLRLVDIILEIAKKSGGPKIYLMPWDNPSQVETYAKSTENVLRALEDRLGKGKVFVYRSPKRSDEDEMFFSHHQKLVAIDRKTAFIGGIDLAYGRYDDETYCLKADADGRDGMNRYNSCIPATGTVVGKIIDHDLLLGGWYSLAGNRKKVLDDIITGHALQPVKTGSRVSLDPATQPRMPWQDLQQRIDGPAAANVAASFILRWNIGAGSALVPTLDPPVIATKPIPGDSGCSVQVLRSASANLRNAEAGKVAEKDAEAAFPNQKGKPEGAEDDIRQALLTLINESRHYIYIENQFFTTAFGAPSPARDAAFSGPANEVNEGVKWGVRATRTMPGDADGPIRNAVCQALADRIRKAIITKGHPPFHVYIVLPVHPEGFLNAGPTMTQIHWTMQSLVFGRQSLLERVKAALKEVKRDPEEWPQYLTLLNLRNWAQLGDRYVTEQIYVHTKLIIVDDCFVLHGSANINDRSLLGRRDSEIAVLVHDSQEEYTDLDGTGRQVLTLKHARATRKAIWRKIFGLEQKICLPTGGAHPANELAGMIDRPADPKTVKAIQSVAQANTDAYEAVFDWVPRNVSIFDESEASSIWSRWEYPNGQNPLRPKERGSLNGLMPFQEVFWKATQFKANAVAQLNSIKGFITALPIRWTERENNNLGYHIALVAINDVPLPRYPGASGEKPTVLTGMPPSGGREV